MIDPQMIVLVVVAAILGFGAFWGFLRKLRRTLLRFLTLVLSFVASIFLVKLFGKYVGGYVISLLQPVLGESFSEILTGSEIALVADALCEMIAAPILFTVCYALLKIVSWIVYKVFVFVFAIKGPKLFGRLLGAAAGLLCGFVGLIALVTPVFGFATLANDAWKQLQDEQDAQAPNVLEQVLEAPVAKECYQLVGKHIFAYLTTVDFEEDKASLQQETSAVIAIWKDAEVLVSSSFEQYSETETQAMKKMVSDVGASKIVSTVVASFVSDASKAWVSGETAFGIAKPNMGDDVQGIVDAVFVVFSDTTSATLVQDLGTFADLFDLLVSENVFTMGNDNADFVNKLVSGGIVERLYAILDANERMTPVKTAIRDTGVRVMMSQLGVPEELRETHGDMLEEMADTLKSVTADDGTIDQAALSAGICDVMNGYDIAVSEEASQLIAEAIVENLTAEEIATLSPEAIADKMAERFLAGGSLPIPAV